ncbi:hypothetical protein BGC_53160 [Burkholderia sp. 3C]
MALHDHLVAIGAGAVRALARQVQFGAQQGRAFDVHFGERHDAADGVPLHQRTRGGQDFGVVGVVFDAGDLVEAGRDLGIARRDAEEFVSAIV